MRCSQAVRPETPIDGFGPARFTTTRWSIVSSCSDSANDEEKAHAALAELCKIYWRPVFAFICRQGHSVPDAQDLTQEFFTQLIRKEHLRLADREKGKFRTFLLATLDYFLAREWSRAHRQKRGGHFIFISLEQQSPEQRYQLEPPDNDTPEKKFSRNWALAILTQTMSVLESECQTSGKQALFEEVKTVLAGEGSDEGYAEISRRLGMGEGALRMAVHRLRQRYGELLRNEIAQTVSGPEEVEEEMRYLKIALSQ